MVGKDRSTIANVLRILNLPAPIREMVQDGRLTAGQARPLIGMDNEKQAIALARDIAHHGWSAREVERRARETAPTPGVVRRGRPKKEDTRPAEVRSLEQRLRKHFQTDASITLKAGNRGSVVLGFYSADDLERLVEAMGVPDVQQ
jgi:ParB family chromosome partitioning protein